MIELKYMEASLEDVARFFSDHYEIPKGTKCLGVTWYIDVVRGTVIFKLVLERSKKKAADD